MVFSVVPRCCKLYWLEFILECLTCTVFSTNSIAPASGFNDFDLTVNINGIRTATVSVPLKLRNLVRSIAARTGYWPGSGGFLA